MNYRLKNKVGELNEGSIFLGQNNDQEFYLSDDKVCIVTKSFVEKSGLFVENTEYEKVKAIIESLNDEDIANKLVGLGITSDSLNA